MKHIWRVKKPQPELRQELISALGIDEVIAQLLINRDFSDKDLAAQFLTTDRKALINPYRFQDMGAAVGRIRKALARRERIMLYGDYDVDGITGAAVLHFCLQKLGANFFTYIPHRIKEGYGLHDEPIRLAVLQGVKVMITIDCGTSEAKRIEWAHKQGIETIVVDHHEAKGRIPEAAISIINPKMPGSQYPFRHLTSVGLAFKLFTALIDSAAAAEHLDLVAMGTISDVAPLVGENRVLVRQGLEVIRNTEKPGLKSLMRVSGIAGRPLTSDHVGFALGPRINASGRIGHGFRAFQMLTTKDPEEAESLAQELDRENKDRQKLERRILNEAIDKVDGQTDFANNRIIVIWDDRWHLGVVGIVAARLVERYHRPAIVIALEGDVGRGSGRTMNAFHLFDTVRAASKHLVKFGGHAQAIGLEIRRKDLVNFREEINRVAVQTLEPTLLEPVLNVDMEVRLNDLTSSVMEGLGRMAPYGTSNPRPVFLSRGLSVRGRATQIGREGLKFWVEYKNRVYETVGFRHRHLLPIVNQGGPLDMVFTPEMRSWDGRESLQLVLRGLRPTA